MTTFFTLLLGLLGYLPHLRSLALTPPPAPPFNAEILRDGFEFEGQDALIRRRDAIDARLTSMTLIYRDDVRATAGGHFIAYVDGSTIRKIIESYYMESGKYRTTYYFENDGRPLYASTRAIVYNHPFYVDASASGKPWMHATLDEEEMFFANGEPVLGTEAAEELYKAAEKSADDMKSGRYPRYVFRGTTWVPITTPPK